MSEKPSRFRVIIDTREQTPWKFPDDVQTVPGTLATGDYSLAGSLQELCAIERKSLADIVGCITGDDRERFKRELLRLKAYRCKAVIIEATLHDIELHRYKARTTPESVIGSLASWQTRYDVPFIFAGDAEGGARYCLAILRNYHKQVIDFIQQIRTEE